MEVTHAHAMLKKGNPVGSDEFTDSLEELARTLHSTYAAEDVLVTVITVAILRSRPLLRFFQEKGLALAGPKDIIWKSYLATRRRPAGWHNAILFSAEMIV